MTELRNRLMTAISDASYAARFLSSEEQPGRFADIANDCEVDVREIVRMESAAEPILWAPEPLREPEERCGAFGTTTGDVCILPNDHDGAHVLPSDAADVITALRTTLAAVEAERDRYKKGIEAALDKNEATRILTHRISELKQQLAAAQRVVESAYETREFYRENLGERGHPFPLSDLFAVLDECRTALADADAGEAITHFVIPASAGLDPIRVVAIDHEPGKGTLIVQCYNQAWTCYFGAMSGRTLMQFIARVDRDYLGGAFGCGNKHYLANIAEAVILAARERALRTPDADAGGEGA